jgi:hypothetical protein
MSTAKSIKPAIIRDYISADGRRFFWHSLVPGSMERKGGFSSVRDAKRAAEALGYTVTEVRFDFADEA